MRTAALAFLLLLSACGQSGDLYLPSGPAPAASEAASPVPPAPDLPPEENSREEKKPQVEKAP